MVSGEVGVVSKGGGVASGEGEEGRMVRYSMGEGCGNVVLV